MKRVMYIDINIIIIIIIKVKELKFLLSNKLYNVKYNLRNLNKYSSYTYMN